MLTSIIIPTYNRDNYLKRCLVSLIKQNSSKDEYEIIVVDNGSTDKTRSVTEEAIKSYAGCQIRYLYEPVPGLLSGRHRGALESKGEICVFIDDDIEADFNWLEAIKQSFQDPLVQLVGGRNLPSYETYPPEWLNWFWREHPFGKFCPELSLLDFGEEPREINPNYVWGLNFSIRRQALFDLGGFHPDCIPKQLQHFQGDGETGLTIKAGEKSYKTIYQPNALIWHQVSMSRMTYRYFEQRYFYQGVCDSYTQIRRLGSLPNPNNNIKLLGQKIRGPIQKIGRELFTKSRYGSNAEREATKNKFLNSLQAGVKFHQDSVRQNPRLLSWIVKPDYWDYKLPNY